MTEEEKLAEENAEEYFGKPTELVEVWKVKAYKEAFLAGYEQGIGRLRYCCTCKKWKECEVWDKAGGQYGICADWEIKE